MEKGVLIVPVNNLKAFRIGWGLLPIHSIMAALKKKCNLLLGANALQKSAYKYNKKFWFKVNCCLPASPWRWKWVLTFAEETSTSIVTNFEN